MRFFLSFILTTSYIFTYSQNLINSRQNSYYTYIYKITDAEALKIYRNKKTKIKESYFHTLIDSFPTDSVYHKKLPNGHYIKMYADKNLLKFAISSVHSFDLVILNNNTDLCIQLFDSVGNIISNAKLAIRGKQLKYEEVLKAFVHRKSNKKGILEIEYQGNTLYYDLKRGWYNPTIRRISSKFLYRTPIKYIWRPINFVIHLPVDGVKSITKHYTYGTIYNTEHFFINLAQKIAFVFDKTSYNGDEKFSKRYTGFLVFNKPKYQPGDTVKFKAFITKKNGKAVNNEVNIVFRNGNYKRFELIKLKPYRKGAYEYQFYLHDSLELKLDKSCSVIIEKKPYYEYIKNYFNFEEYELSNVNLSIRTNSENQYKGKNFEIYVSGKDENELNLTDARIEISAKTQQILKYSDSNVYIPNDLLFIKKSLDINGETAITIPDSIFPPVDLTYELKVRLLTSDNDFKEENKTINYFHEKTDIKLELREDSMFFSYHENDIEKEVQAKIFGIDKFGNQTKLPTEQLPYKQKINPYFYEYKAVTKKQKSTFRLSDKDALLKCFSERTKDSIHILVENPRNLTFNYFIYKLNKELTKGCGTTLDWKFKTRSDLNYYVSIQYLWGGEVISNTYKIDMIENQLTIDVEQPRVVFPGQKVTIDVKVTNQEGQPVPDVDVTAWSITKKFKYNIPEIPEFQKKTKEKAYINSFVVSDKTDETKSSMLLRFNQWKSKLGLDSIEYYNFIFPGNKIYHHSCQTPDKVTQFLPFITNNGIFEKVHVIYVDMIPVYFSWSTNKRPYSFEISPGIHHIKIRTRSKQFELDSVYFTANQKNIISLSDSIRSSKVRVTKLKYRLNEFEKKSLYKYILPYRYNFKNNFAYLIQNGKISSLIPDIQFHYTHLMAGPVYPFDLDFILQGEYNTHFKFEPYFEYEFNRGLLKMREYKKNKFPFFLYGKAYSEITDSILKVQDIINEWNNYIEKTRYNYIQEKTNYYHWSYSTGLIIDYSTDSHDSTEIPLFVLIRNANNCQFQRIKPGIIYNFTSGQTEYYQVVFIFKHFRYHIIDSVEVKPKGVNYVIINRPDKYIGGTFEPETCDKEVRENFIKTNQYAGVGYNKRKTIKEEDNSGTFNNSSFWTTVEGIVTNEENNPLPGVNISIIGTSDGTITDLEGHYSLSVPPGCNRLMFSYIGYFSKEKQITGNWTGCILTEETLNIDDIVIIGYGTTKKVDITGSVSTVRSQSLMGRMPGVTISNSSNWSDSQKMIRIRGAASINGSSEPLFIVDGQVYLGDISKLDKNSIKSIEVLKGSEATTLYGDKAVNGVILIKIKHAASKSKTAEVFDDEFLGSSMSNSSIRKNFSDYAFWQPRLRTNQDGIASFEVVFPDNITNWKTFFIAMNENSQTGKTEKSIKSYKPLVTQLTVPRFLMENDSCYIIGKAKNYLMDSISLETKLEIDNNLIYSKKQNCKDVLIDTMLVSVEKKDSIEIKYTLNTHDGYFDGEQKVIPMFPIGLEETKGHFFVLDKDSILTLEFDTTMKDVILYAKVNELDVIKQEIESLIDYRYACNEQLASKLKAMLSLKIISNYKKEPFAYEKQTKQIIQKLVDNQQDNGCWGWWHRNGFSPWISIHVLTALYKAQELGFHVKLNDTRNIDNMIWQLQQNPTFELLQLLYNMKVPIDYAKYIKVVDSIIHGHEHYNLYEELALKELKQKCNQTVPKESVIKYLKKTLFGNFYFAQQKADVRYFYENEVQNTLTAYRILRNDSTFSRDSLLKIRNYLFEKRSNRNWLNTYESAQVIETILPDILDSTKKTEKTVLNISGDLNIKVDKFPFETKLKANQKIKISKTGTFPVYLTAYQHYWNKKPKGKSNDFSIETHFAETEIDSILISGKSYTLQARVHVKKDAEYVMVEVPILASCSYEDKSNQRYWEVHREYFKNKVSIFCERLSTGNYTFNIKVIPRYTGKYTLNPAKVELMYFPTFNANNEIKKVVVE